MPVSPAPLVLSGCALIRANRGIPAARYVNQKLLLRAQHAIILQEDGRVTWRCSLTQPVGADSSPLAHLWAGAFGTGYRALGDDRELQSTTRQPQAVPEAAARTDQARGRGGRAQAVQDIYRVRPRWIHLQRSRYSRRVPGPGVLGGWTSHARPRRQARVPPRFGSATL
jgi:hypothetical protein